MHHALGMDGMGSFAKKPKILLVDDEPALSEAYKLVLDSEGCQVETAMNGKEALECLKRDAKRDLVLVDYSMPQMSGPELAQEIRALYPQLFNANRLVIASLFPTNSPQVEQLRLEKIPFVEKPNDLYAILPVIKMLLSQVREG
jgi:CheY-like chemotaxis protein